MRARISQHMDFDRELVFLGEVSIDEQITWTWIVETWGDDDPPPWRNDVAYDNADRADLPITWIARDTIHFPIE